MKILMRPAAAQLNGNSPIFYLALTVALLLGGLPDATALPPRLNQPAEIAQQDISAEEVDTTGLLPADIALLRDSRFGWKHLQTERFILHYEQKIFAAKVARMGEQFYEAISGDLPNLKDRVSPVRSHIFIFRQARDWQAVVASVPGLDPRVISFVRAQAMYLQEFGTGAEKFNLLAHEMTHLVFNRFLPVRLPLWLNEGLAEYYGEFAYRAARGLGQSKKSAFPPLRHWTPLAELLTTTSYPASAVENTRFYATSKYLTGYLLLKHPREKWDAFFDRLLAGEHAIQALLLTYGWADIAAMEKDFAKFLR